jgi:sigma-E factor negative regulatory protein RseC
MEVEAVNTIGARVGDTVAIDFETSSLLKISFLLYIVPVFGMIAGAVIGHKLALFYQYDESLFSAIFGFLFFFSLIPIIKSRGNKLAQKNEYRPKIVRILKRQ